MLGFLLELSGFAITLAGLSAFVAYATRPRRRTKWYPSTIVKGPPIQWHEWVAASPILLIATLFALIHIAAIVHVLNDFAEMSASYAYHSHNVTRDENGREYTFNSWADHRSWWRNGKGSVSTKRRN